MSSVTAEVATVSTAATDGKGIVLFDGTCPLCQRSIKVLKALDWFGLIAFQDARDTAHLPHANVPLDSKRLLEEMHVLTPDRQHAYAGFRAFRWIAWRLPVTLAFAPFLYLPGVPWIGNKIYLWVAKNRYDLVPCHNGACQVNLKRK
ncbi:thiol-disulfide oxidoreductase DCC family protein [Fimbriiglobus ruber]|uniref:Cell division inhibitor n=1 Tax=Fimbriiglobus ruber TaxID=1908690 RepID=A0A225DDW5_9BACT|nr:DUF393 domain-containing protein [Fimbriiglobus ruber]OWK35536.1 hypothetical protein FRUB_08099 [Fimbriiglobus ruber]